MDKLYFVYCDGGSRGNPGPAAIAFLIKDSHGKILFKSGNYIGKATNNVAEYSAVISALKWIGHHAAINQKNSVIRFHLDSSLVVNQLNGRFKIKNSVLRDSIVLIKQLERAIKAKIFYRHIPREKNQEADAIVNDSFPIC
jgi:ribonuclease HI